MSIRGAARKGVDAAFKAAGDAVVTCTLRLNPSNTYDPATDTTATVWGFDEPLACVPYDDTEEREGMAPEKKRRNFIFKGIGLAGLTGEQEGTVIDEDFTTWEIWMVESDPTKSVWIFYGRNPSPAAPEPEPDPEP